MFTPIHLLPQYDSAKSAQYRNRWEDQQGREVEARILQMIREGAGEDFLQSDFEHGAFPILEDYHDLRGISIFQEDITFPEEDNFEFVCFSYAQFHHSKFRNAAFQSTFSFSRIYNCEFIDCVFAFTSFYGAQLEKVKFTNCEFFEHNNFTNCSFTQTEFSKCFIPDSIFQDCRFDETTQFSDPVDSPVRMSKSSLELDRKNLAGSFGGVKEAYAAGGAVKQARRYYFRQMQALTRHNTPNRWERLGSYLMEYVAGYGVKWQRVLATMVGVLLVATAIFSLWFGLSDGLLVAAGAVFTFGAKSDLLSSLGVGFRVFYVLIAFLGVSLTALFVTVLANLWFRER